MSWKPLATTAFLPLVMAILACLGAWPLHCDTAEASCAVDSAKLSLAVEVLHWMDAARYSLMLPGALLLIVLALIGIFKTFSSAVLRMHTALIASALIGLGAMLSVVATELALRAICLTADPNADGCMPEEAANLTRAIMIGAIEVAGGVVIATAVASAFTLAGNKWLRHKRKKLT